jgi:hypothetical protein
MFHLNTRIDFDEVMVYLFDQAEIPRSGVCISDMTRFFRASAQIPDRVFGNRLHGLNSMIF